MFSQYLTGELARQHGEDLRRAAEDYRRIRAIRGPWRERAARVLRPLSLRRSDSPKPVIAEPVAFIPRQPGPAVSPGRQVDTKPVTRLP